MSRITINSLAAVQTLNQAEMAAATGGLSLSLPRLPFPFPIPRPRLRCFTVRIPFTPIRKRVCVPVLF